MVAQNTEPLRQAVIADSNHQSHRGIETAKEKTKEHEAGEAHQDSMEHGQPVEENSSTKLRCLIILLVVLAALIGALVGAFLGIRLTKSDSNSTYDTSDKPLTNNGSSQTTSPTSVHPNFSWNFPPPSKADCAAIADNQTTSGNNNNNRDGISFHIDLDVPLEVDTSADVLLPVLGSAIQSIILPSLVGCDDVPQRRLLRERLLNDDPNKYVIQNAKLLFIIEAQNESCKAVVLRPCKRLQVGLDLFLQGEEPMDKLVEKIFAAFRDGKGDNPQRLKIKLQLGSPFVGVGVASVTSATGADDDDYDDDGDDAKDDDETDDTNVDDDDEKDAGGRNDEGIDDLMDDMTADDIVGGDDQIDEGDDSPRQDDDTDDVKDDDETDDTNVDDDGEKDAAGGDDEGIDGLMDDMTADDIVGGDDQIDEGDDSPRQDDDTDDVTDDDETDDTNVDDDGEKDEGDDFPRQDDDTDDAKDDNDDYEDDDDDRDDDK